MNDRESLVLAIKGQVKPFLWDKTKDDTRFAAIQASKCDEFEDIREMWCGEFSPSISEKMELEG